MAKSTSEKPASANKPAHTVRMGVIKATLWKNAVSGGGFVYNVVLVRIYMDDARQWHETSSLGRDDLLLAAKVLDAAHTWIFEHGTQETR